MASNISNFDIFMPFRPYVSKDSKLILYTSNKFNISIQHSLITLSKFKIVYSEISLEYIFHIYGCLRRISCTECVQCIHNSHVQIYSFSLEQSTCRLSFSQNLIYKLIP